MRYSNEFRYAGYMLPILISVYALRRCIRPNKNICHQKNVVYLMKYIAIQEKNLLQEKNLPAYILKSAVVKNVLLDIRQRLQQKFEQNNITLMP